LGCSDHGGESVPSDPMRTGSTRIAHGSYNGITTSISRKTHVNHSGTIVDMKRRAEHHELLQASTIYMTKGEAGDSTVVMRWRVKALRVCTFLFRAIVSVRRLS
jgi:hypothetical protein